MFSNEEQQGFIFADSGAYLNPTDIDLQLQVTKSGFTHAHAVVASWLGLIWECFSFCVCVIYPTFLTPSVAMKIWINWRTETSHLHARRDKAHKFAQLSCSHSELEVMSAAVPPITLWECTSIVSNTMRKKYHRKWPGCKLCSLLNYDFII